MKNKITTPGYFVKRLRDNGFIVLKIFNGYGTHDPRRWTVLVDPGGASLYITCFQNKDFLNDVMFELDDGGIRINKNYYLKTDSIEVVIRYLLDRGISNNAKNTPYYAERPKYKCETPRQA